MEKADGGAKDADLEQLGLGHEIRGPRKRYSHYDRIAVALVVGRYKQRSLPRNIAEPLNPDSPKHSEHNPEHVFADRSDNEVEHLSAQPPERRRSDRSG